MSAMLQSCTDMSQQCYENVLMHGASKDAENISHLQLLTLLLILTTQMLECYKFVAYDYGLYAFVQMHIILDI